MRGRKPKPTNLKKIEGNPGKRKLNTREPQHTGETTPPAHLTGVAKTEWRRLYSELKAMGLITRVDRASLAAYCQAYARWVKYELVLQEKGELYKTASGSITTSPALWIVNKALDQMHKFAVEFGFTPASRSRLTLPSEKQADSFDKLLDYCNESTKKA